MRIGIISDTHGSLDPRAYAALADCDHIIHAGDIGGPSVLCELETLAPVTAVLGNNDFDEYGSAAGHFAHPVLEGVRFLVGHKPGDVHRPRSDFGRTIAKMDVEAGRILHTWVKNLDGKVLMEA